MGDDGPQLAPARQNCPRSRAARGGDRAVVRGASRPGKGGVGGLFPDERPAPSPSGIACPNIQPAYWANHQLPQIARIGNFRVDGHESCSQFENDHWEDETTVSCHPEEGSREGVKSTVTGRLRARERKALLAIATVLAAK